MKINALTIHAPEDDESSLAESILYVAGERFKKGTLSTDVQEALATEAQEKLKDAATRSRVLDAISAYGRGEVPSEDSPTTTLKAVVDPQDPEDAPVVYPKLATHDMDVPEEPEEVDVVALVFNQATQQWEEKSLGLMTLVPTGCNQPIYADPYASTVTTISALPRDKQAEANLYALYQKQGWAGIDWIRGRLKETIVSKRENAAILDDIPMTMALEGKPMESGSPGVAQTPGATGGGNSNGAPPPPGPGPGRGNKYAPGDNAA